MKELAQTNSAASGVEGDLFVIFMLGDEEYGVEVLKVQEIIGCAEFTKVPNVPPFIRGVINLRGSVVPVVDLRTKFGFDEKEYDNFTVTLILEVRERIIGVVVDAVLDVIRLDEDTVQAVPDFSSGVRADFISAIGRRSDTLTILLDIDRVLDLDGLELPDAA